MPTPNYVVSYDGSVYSEKAVKWAIDLAGMTGAKIVLLAVCDTSLALLMDLEMDSCRWIRTKIAERARLCQECGFPVTYQMRKGHVVEEIIKYAREEEADLIIAGTRGMGGFGKLLLGSVAHKLVTYSTVPVLIVK
ncbi:MAG TPA: universal stress protein [Patescibacteria group bacterium]|nr:universal stress protein [Patescibacteria group bacterium]